MRQVKLATQGDADALQRLVVEYHRSLHGVVDGAMDRSLRRHFGPEDILQAAYAAAFKAVSEARFDSPAAFYKWLETIALHELKNHRRSLQTKKRDAGREIHGSTGASTSYPDLLRRVAAPDSTPSRRVARSEAAAAILSSLARLPDGQREVIRLRFLEGKSVDEVAARLGKTKAAIHGLCRRGLRALRTFLVSISRFESRK